MAQRPIRITCELLTKSINPQPSTKPATKISIRTTRAAAAALVSSLILLMGANWLQDNYRDASRKASLAKSYSQCRVLAEQLKKPAGTQINDASAHRTLIAAVDRCNKSVAEDNAFPGFEKLEADFTQACVQPGVPPRERCSAAAKFARSGAAEFLLSADSAGHYVYRMALGVLYTTLIFGFVILLLRAIESSVVTDKPIADMVEAMRKWFDAGGAKGGGMAAGVASVLAPVALATPVMLGGVLALRSEPVDLKVNAAQTQLTLNPTIGENGLAPVNVPLWFLPDVAPTPFAVTMKVNHVMDGKQEFPLRIKPFVEARAGQDGKKPPAGQVPTSAPSSSAGDHLKIPESGDSLMVSVGMPTLETKLQAMLVSLERYQAMLDKQRSGGADVSSDDLALPLMELNETQLQAVKEARTHNESLLNILRTMQGIVRSRGPWPE